MSILPSDANRSEPSIPLSLSRSPSPDHGPLLSQSLRRPFFSGDAAGSTTAGDLHVSTSEPLFVTNSDCLDMASMDSCGLSEKMTDVRNPERGNCSQNHGNSFHGDSSSRGILSSQFKLDQVNSAQLSGKVSGAVSLSQIEQTATGFSNAHGSTSHSVARKSQTINANHLLKFYYDPISRSQPRMLTSRKPQKQKMKPYNKDLFLQANFKFVVLDSGKSAIEMMDPDKMLQWEDVICVRYSTPFPLLCPICLENPLCPQITSCGHIYCFPCILHYLLMGEEDHKGDCWKKCPLCFMMISAKDLYTIYIDRVKHYQVRDHVDFALLSRAKGSLVPYQKNQEVAALLSSNDSLCDSFSKFTLTSDIDLSVREAKLVLDGWLAKAESGLVEDLEQLPYVCAALEHLEQRKKNWTGHKALSGSSPIKSVSDRTSRELVKKASSVVCKDEASGSYNLSPEKLRGNEYFLPPDAPESVDGTEKNSCLYGEDRCFHWHHNGLKDAKEKDSYIFYQAVDGQHLILHPLNTKCLLQHYGSYDMLPSRVGGQILQMETITQSEAIRKRYPFLSHFSLTTTFQFCEIDLSDILPPEALSPFIDEIKRREKQRKRTTRKESEEKARAEAAAAALSSTAMPYDLGFQSYKDLTFSIHDFEALGSSPASSSSPPVTGERKLFSEVARLGFAAVHDSPSLRAEEPIDASNSLELKGEASSLTGPRTAPTLSFANIISTSKSEGGQDARRMNALGKKGKKSSRVLLSTAGGRRY